MIRKIAVFAAAICISCSVWADKTDHFNLSLVPPVETSSNRYIEGLDLGILSTTKDKVEGVQTGFIYAANKDTSTGLQFAMVTRSHEFYGLQEGFVNMSEKLYGESSGFVNISKEVWGASSGFVNVSEKVKGVMGGFVNVSDEMSGLQIGFVNYTQDIEGIQIGLVNIITRSSLPVMVIVNGRFK